MFNYRALYIHIPFCLSRCSYCDFATEALSSDNPAIDAYIENIIRSVRAASREELLGSLTSIYLGGGTPTHIGARRLVNLIYTLSLSINLRPDTEFTLEANPESVTPALVRDVFALGVNRFSLGIQSFNDTELLTLGRAHNAEQAHEAIRAIQERFENISLDLICGIPGQSLATWRASLDAALVHEVTHISIYPLAAEEGTPLASAIEQGSIAPLDEDLQAEMMLFAQRYLEQQGFTRYEVASYARAAGEKDYRSRHNMAYWTGLAYLGLGEYAASMRFNPATGKRERLLGTKVVEALTPEEAALEDIMLGMRLVHGVPISQVDSLVQKLPSLAKTFSELIELELVEKTAAHYVPTQRGWLLGNELYSRIWSNVR